MTPRPGRTRKGKTALTPAVQEQICNALLLGTDRVSAAHFAGVSYESFRSWVRRGESGEKPFAAFAAAVQKAEADAVVRLVGHIESAIESKSFPCRATVTFEGRCSECGAPFHEEKKCRNHIEVPGSWTAAAWKLERRHPQHYGQRQHVEVENIVTAENIVVLMRELAEAVVAAGVTDEQREMIAAMWTEIARRRGVLPAAEDDATIQARRARARAAQAKLPGLAP